MHKVPSHINTQGFSLIEVVISASLVLVLSTLFTAAVLYGQESTQIAGQRNRAGLLAEEGLEAARNIRDASFSSLVNGTYGISQSAGKWTSSGTSDTQDIFTRSITVSTVDAVTKQVTSTVTWPENGSRTGNTTLITYLTNTQLLSQQANCLVVSASGANLASGNKELRGITIQNICASSIIISKITVNWITLLNKIQQIDINGSGAKVWSSTGPGTPTGTQNSGTQLTIAPYTLAANSTVIPITRFLFTAGMLANTFTITFTMSDGSTKTVTTLAL